jgi:hypothetical protein
MSGEQEIPQITNLIRIIHTLPVADVFRVLLGRPEGLTAQEAGRRSQIFGPNTIRKIAGKPLYVKFLSNFTHLMAILLWVGGIVAFIAQMPQLGVAVWMVNVINGIFSFWQEYRAEKATEALLKMLPHQVRVLRDGRDEVVLSESLVPGDVMTLLKLRRGQYSLVENKVDPKSVAAGKAVKDLDLPSECVLPAIIRNGNLIIPRGDTIVQADDKVFALVHVSQLDKLASILKCPEDAKVCQP